MRLESVALLMLIVVSAVIIPFGVWGKIWLAARRAGVPVSMFTIVRMYFIAGAEPSLVVPAMVYARLENIDVPVHDLERLAACRGRPVEVVRGIVEARRLGVEVPFDTAAELDQAGKNIVAYARERLAERG